MVWVLKVFGLIAFQPVILLVEVVNKKKKNDVSRHLHGIHIQHEKHTSTTYNTCRRKDVIHADATRINAMIRKVYMENIYLA